MNASIRDLQNELNALVARRAKINLEPLKAAAQDAKAAREGHQPASSRAYVVDAVERELSAQLGAAEQALRNAKAEAAALDRQISPLQQMLKAPEAIASAEADLAALHRQNTVAQEALCAANDVCRMLADQLTDLSAENAAHREHAARATLEAARNGKTLKPAPIDRGAQTTIENALELAESERDTALQNVNDLALQIRDAEAELRNAQAAAAGLRYELACRDFVQADAEYVQESNEPFDSDGLVARINQALFARGLS